MKRTNSRITASIIITNGRVLTVDETAPRAEALVLRRREAAYVGNARGAVTYQG